MEFCKWVTQQNIMIPYSTNWTRLVFNPFVDGIGSSHSRGLPGTAGSSLIILPNWSINKSDISPTTKMG